jgi:hypothetical protein
LVRRDFVVGHPGAAARFVAQDALDALHARDLAFGAQGRVAQFLAHPAAIDEHGGFAFAQQRGHHVEALVAAQRARVDVKLLVVRENSLGRHAAKAMGVRICHGRVDVGRGQRKATGAKIVFGFAFDMAR